MKKEPKKTTVFWIALIITWLFVLTAVCIDNLVLSLETKSLSQKASMPSKERFPKICKDGLLRYFNGQLQINAWDDKWLCADGLIRTRLGIDSLRAEIDRKFACLEAGGHKWQFKEEKGFFIFKCENCQKVKAKTSEDLTPKEREALHNLNIL